MSNTQFKTIVSLILLLIQLVSKVGFLVIRLYYAHDNSVSSSPFEELQEKFNENVKKSVSETKALLDTD